MSKGFQDLKGLFPAVVTMFDEKGEINEKGMRTHINYLIDNGVHGVVCLGTAGEFIAVTDEERRRIFRIFLDEAKDRVPVYCMTGFYDTRRTVELSKKAEEMGADGLMIILPYFQRPAKESVLNHYRTVRQNTDLPIMLYNNSTFSACDPLDPWEIAQLSKEGVISAVKTNTGETMVLHNIKTLLPADSRLNVFHGSYLTAFEALVSGADGWISGILNFMPAECRQMWDMVKVNEDYKNALKLWREKFVPVIQLMHFNKKGGEPEFEPFVKEIIRLRCKVSGYPRKPYTPLTNEFKAKIKNVMAKTGLI